VINAQSEKQTRGDSTKDPSRQMGQRSGGPDMLGRTRSDDDK
jgi:hypothetical protein